MTESVHPWQAYGRAYGLPLALFIASFAVALALNWQAADLIWGFWISSLITGYVLIVVRLVRKSRYRSHGSDPWYKRLTGLLFGLAFFSLHFGGFHYGQSLALLGYFPIEGTQGWPWDGVLVLLSRYWPMVLATLALRWSLIFTPVKDTNTRQSFSPAAAYHSVIKIHLLIFLLAFTEKFNLPPLLIYFLVYGLFFFPFAEFSKEKKQQRAAAADNAQAAD